MPSDVQSITSLIPPLTPIFCTNRSVRCGVSLVSSRETIQQVARRDVKDEMGHVASCS